MGRVLFIFLMSWSIGQTIYTETWFNVNNQAIRLRRLTNCHHVSRGNQQDTCDCCLIKAIEKEHLSPSQAIRKCATSYHCRFPHGSYIREESATTQIKQARKNLRAMTIIDIERLAYPVEISKNGVLSNEDVRNIIQSLHKEKYLDLPANLFEEDKIMVKPLGASAKGHFSGQLFSISYNDNSLTDETMSSSTKPLYVLKETKKGVKEIKHLYQISVSPLINEKISTTEKMADKEVLSESMAQIAFDDVHFKIKTMGETRYFSLLQTAPGKSLHHHFVEFGEVADSSDCDNPQFQVALKKIKHIFYRVGESISLLHQKYAVIEVKRPFAKARTYLHGDLHSANIFFDEKTDLVTLIDNETFALSLKRPSSGVNDIVEFYIMHTIHTLAHQVSRQLTINQEFGIHDQLWHELWRSLFAGYFAAFGPISKDEFEVLYQGFRQEFFDGFSELKIFESIRYFMDQRKLKRFGPSIRRSQIKHHELAKLFDIFYQSETKKYLDQP